PLHEQYSSLLQQLTSGYLIFLHPLESFPLPFQYRFQRYNAVFYIISTLWESTLVHQNARLLMYHQYPAKLILPILFSFLLIPVPIIPIKKKAYNRCNAFNNHVLILYVFLHYEILFKYSWYLINNNSIKIKYGVVISYGTP